VIKRIYKFVKHLLRQLAGVPPVLLEEMPDSPIIFRTYRYLILTGHKRVPGGWIYGGEFYPDYLTVGGNSFAIRRTALKYCKGKGLDIGASFWPLPGSTPIDTESGPGIANKLKDVPTDSQDYVFSSHCLEHIENWKEALDQWIMKIKPGGLLFLYLPHPSCKLWTQSNPQVSAVHRWEPEPGIVCDALMAKRMEIVDRDDGPDHFYSFYVCARKK
jgi:SAM-dependent methyltransferase